jgi:xylulokinase
VTRVSLGLDVGTGSTKAGFVDEAGRLLAVGRSPHAVRRPRPGWAETAPRHWVASARSAVTDLYREVPEARVVGVGLSGQMHGVVLCDPTGTPVRPAVLWPDRRAEDLLRRLAPRLEPHGAALGNPLVPGMAGPILAALVEAEPAVVGRARWYLQPKDWLRLVLTGAAGTEPSDASATLLWDLPADGWSAAATRVFRVDPDRLPDVSASTDVVVVASTPAARTLELRPGTPMTIGGADTAMALLGAGVAAGETQISIGTGGQIARPLDRMVPDESRRTHLYRAVGSAPWYAMAAIQNVGIAIDWALGVLAASTGEATRALEDIAPGADGVTFVPYLTGERTPHLDARLTGQWVGLRPEVSRAALLRAVYEGVAFAVRDGLESLRAAGHVIDHALLAGGGSTSPSWRALLADALRIPLVPHHATDASVRGAGILGWVGAGVLIDPAAHVRRSPPVVPGPDRLGEAFARYREVTSRVAGSGRGPRHPGTAPCGR